MKILIFDLGAFHILLKNNRKFQEKYFIEKHEALCPYNMKAKTCRRQPEQEVDGKFECQPEYRKAYIDYLVREKKPPSIPKKRIAGLFENVEKIDTSTTEDARYVVLHIINFIWTAIPTGRLSN